MLRWIFGRRKASTRRWKLEAPLLEWAKGEAYSIRDSFSGCIIMGSTGSGKSSGSMRAVTTSMMRAGYGGIFFCVKREDAATYVQYVKDVGRERDLVVYSPDTHPLRFSFIAAEIAQTPDPQSLADNLTALILAVASLGDVHRGARANGGGNGGEAGEYFRQAAERLCRFALLVLVLSGEPVTMTHLYRLIVSTPRSRAESLSPEWQAGSFFFACTRLAARAAKNASQQADFELAILYFMEEYTELNSRTRSTVESTLTAATDALSRGTARDALSAPPDRSNFDPAMLGRGSLVVLDYPVLVHANVGRLIQVVVKNAVMRHQSRRHINESSRPVCVVCDEAQHVLTEHDALFATTARSSRTALVYATQSVSTLMDAFGGRDAEPRMLSFLGNMQCLLMHQQTDVRTIEHLQQLTGRSRQLMMSASTSMQQDWLGSIFGSGGGAGSGGSGGAGGSGGFSEQMDFDLQADMLNSLARGGPPGFFTEAILFQGGRLFANGKTWRRVCFGQGKKR